MDRLIMKKIFLDFETNKESEFYIAGYKIDNEFTQIVLNKDLEGLEKEGRKLNSMDPRSFMIKLLDKALSDNLTIIAYGEHEEKLIKQYLKDDEIEYYKTVKINNIANVVVEFIKKRHRSKYNSFYKKVKNQAKKKKRIPPKQFNLSLVLKFLNYSIPPDYYLGKVSSYFKYAKESLIKYNQDFSDIPPGAKRKATNALKHNKADVEGLEYLISILKDHSAEIS